MILEFLTILFAIGLISIVYLFTRPWIKLSSSRIGSNVKLVVNVKTNVDKINFNHDENGEKFEFERKNLKKGDVVEFVFPCSKNSTKVFAKKEDDQKSFEISH